MAVNLRKLGGERILTIGRQLAKFWENFAQTAVSPFPVTAYFRKSDQLTGN